MRYAIIVAAVLAATNAGAARWVYEYLSAPESHTCLAASNPSFNLDYAEIVVMLNERRWRDQQKPQLAVLPITGDKFGSFHDAENCPTTVTKRSFGCEYTYATRYAIDDDAWTSADFGMSSCAKDKFTTSS
ncbi:MAG: hypothetical protein OXH15_12490 [Gammaproteobacteria bacterium]|nr:hypothetical protein [Gammaproteobacteria bacterium]